MSSLDQRLAVKACIFKGSDMLVLYKSEADRLMGAAPDREDDLPGGCVEPGETLEEALVREVMEETGLSIKLGRPFNSWSMRTPRKLILGIDYLCQWAEGDVRLSEEHESYEWLSLNALQAKNWSSDVKATYEEAFRLMGL